MVCLAYIRQTFESNVNEQFSGMAKVSNKPKPKCSTRKVPVEGGRQQKGDRKWVSSGGKRVLKYEKANLGIHIASQS